MIKRRKGIKCAHPVRDRYYCKYPSNFLKIVFQKNPYSEPYVKRKRETRLSKLGRIDLGKRRKKNISDENFGLNYENKFISLQIRLTFPIYRGLLRQIFFKHSNENNWRCF